MTQNEAKKTTESGVESQLRAGIASAALSRLKQYSTEVFKDRKPWTELLDRSTFARPPSTSEAVTRFRQNLRYFRTNYLMVMLMTVAVCMLMNPGSLLVLMGLFASWIYVFVIRTTPVVIGGRELGDREKLISMSALSFITVFFLTSAGTVLLTSVMLGCTLIALHGATRVPDDLFIDDSQTAPGIWSILKGEQTGQAQISSIV